MVNKNNINRIYKYMLCGNGFSNSYEIPSLIIPKNNLFNLRTLF